MQNVYMSMGVIQNKQKNHIKGSFSTLHDCIREYLNAYKHLSDTRLHDISWLVKSLGKEMKKKGGVRSSKLKPGQSQISMHQNLAK